MDFVEALAALGLEDDAELTRDRVRRTYLRKVREHPPERDPEGFSKVREAYEILRYMPTPEERAAWARLAEASEHVADDDPSNEVTTAVASDADDESVPPEELELPPELLLGVRLEAMLGEVLGLLAEGEVRRAIDIQTAWRAETNDDDHRWVAPFTAMRWVLTRELLGIAPAVAPEVVQALALGIAANDFEVAHPKLAAYRRTQPDKANDAAVVILQRTLALARQLDGSLDGPVRRTFAKLERHIRPIAFIAGPIVLVALFVMNASVQSESRANERKSGVILVAPAPPPEGTAPEVLLEEIRLSAKELQGLGLAAIHLGTYASEAHADAQLCPRLASAVTVVEKSVLTVAQERHEDAASHIVAIRVRVDLLCKSVPQ